VFHDPAEPIAAEERRVAIDPSPAPDANPDEGMWRAILEGTDPRYARARAWLKHVPGSPRCKMCAAPFGRPGHFLMHLVGRDRWSKNPEYCGSCFRVLEAHHGGAEIESSFLFADVRGSTTMAEHISPTEFRGQLHRFYDVAARILVENDGIVDKFVGDEVVGMFIPALTHDGHARRAVDAARALLVATGHGDPAGAWLPIGIGVGTGVAFIGSLGEPPVTTLTGLGDIVNVAARLASAASAGEILLTEATATGSALDTSRLERRALALKGKSDSTDVFVLTAS
jgi:adenylate cyclase